ncbi:MAG: aminopeptidase N [Chloroflexi bacterium]|nr:aminopeptidase N [Chloroflexota bacterium]MDA1145400.1 aminopeptidase N [Chloroflexota bacterium]
MTTEPATRDVLTQIDAEARAATISGVAYDLSLDLTRNAPRYRGECTIRFARSGNGATFLDHTGDEIVSLQVNGQTIAAPDWNGHRLTLAAELLAADNVVHVVYENEYDHTGDGFHQFKDPEDGEEYLYTNCEPYSAHRLFPGFDQPDIKASYQVSVTAPAEWEVVANSAEATRQTLPDGRIRHDFARTQQFATYLFALICGPYHAFRDTHGDIDLGFFARKSLVPHIDEAELFDVTKQGLDFFAEFFDYPYPFGKYDQIFVPEFNAGAMENVGAVTFAEVFVFRDPPTENQRLNRAEVILHEMAHMWFGDLVTMRWWNDLWLNESFATYMSYLALVSATRFDSAWQTFNAGMKNWAYRQDQLITTHPIAGEVADTDQTFLNFDGITYGKGAAVIKQLVATIGLEGFRNGMRTYFQRHAYGNTTLVQFLDALEAGARSVGDERDLHAWAQLWLETASLNTIATTWETDGERISAMTLEQSAPADYPTLRPHTVEVALARDEGGAIVIEALPAVIEAATADVPDAVGMATPDFVFPNYNDHGFAKTALDDASLDFVRARLEDIDDPLLRQLIWQSLWNMVRDQQLRAPDYLSLAGAKIATETDQELVDSTIATMNATVARYVPEDQKAAAAHDAFELAWHVLSDATEPDLQIIWARALFGLALSPADIEQCGRLADGAISVPGLNVDQDMRWSIAERYVAYGLPGAQSRLDGERARDPSDRGQRQMLLAEVSVPDAAVKAAAWDKFLGDGYGSLHLTGAAMGGFQWWVQRDLLEPYVERFFEVITNVFETSENEPASLFFGRLFPSAVDPAILERSQALLDSLGDRLPLLQRKLREANDDLERAIKCRAFAASGAE